MTEPIDEVAALGRRLAIHQRNLDTLEEQKARYGIAVPLHIVNEIAEQEASIAQIKARLARLEGNASTSPQAGGNGDAGAAGSLRRELAEAEANLALIRERKSQYVLEVDIPLQLIKEEHSLLARIAELRARLGE